MLLFVLNQLLPLLLQISGAQLSIAPMWQLWVTYVLHMLNLLLIIEKVGTKKKKNLFATPLFLMMHYTIICADYNVALFLGQRKELLLSVIKYNL